MSVLQGAIWFAILLNLKHLYVFIAPAYIVWLLKSYCLNSGKFFKRLFTLGFIVLAVLTASFGPFITQLPQVTFNYSIVYLSLCFLLFNFFRI